MASNKHEEDWGTLPTPTSISYLDPTGGSPPRRPTRTARAGACLPGRGCPQPPRLFSWPQGGANQGGH
eukprot:8495613-Pyramimonas_sp.AAC.1